MQDIRRDLHIVNRIEHQVAVLLHGQPEAAQR